MNPEFSQWNQEGFIPGPTETEEAYTKRVYFCKNLETELTSMIGAELPFQASDQASQEIKQLSLQQTKELYGITPAWVPIFFNNYQLAPWHGGCAWIFKLNEETPMAAFLQLRACFKNRTSFLGLYKRKELISHELAHVGRMMYEEPKFEEFLAYRAAAGWRRFIGPMVQSSKESLFFISLLALIVLANFAILMTDSGSYYSLISWLTLLPLAVIISALGRLIYRRISFFRCLDQLKKVCDEPEHLIYRLTDKEILGFSHSSPKEILEFIQREASHSFRWKFLSSIYTT